MSASVYDLGDYRERTIRASLEQLPDPSVDVHEAAVLSLEAARLRRELRRLPEPERHVLAWRYGIGCQPLSLRQIARRLGIALGSAWNLEQHALDQLRHHYQHADTA